MALEGFLQEFGLADILQLIYFQKKTGILNIEGKMDTIRLYIVNGNITGLESEKRSEDDKLGRILIKKELITPDDLNAALELQRKEDVRLAHILYKDGIVPMELLIETIEHQITDTIAHIFAWNEGRYEFVPQEEVPEELPITLDTQHLLMDSLRAVDEWSVVESKLDLNTVFKQERVPEANEIDETETLILSLIDGESDVSTIISVSSLGDLETSKAIISLEEKDIIAPVALKIEKKPAIIPEERAKRAFILSAVSIAVAVIVLITFKSELDVFKAFTKARAVTKIERLKNKIELYNVIHGRYPDDINIITTKKDSWRTPYIYIKEKNGFKLFSAGPDKITGTEDDVY